MEAIRWMRQASLARLGLVGATALAGCAGQRAPGAPGILSPRFSESQEIRAGQRAAREATRTLGLVADQALQDYVQQVGSRLAAASERSQLTWTFRVVDDPMPNAFAIPGGYVFLTRGILGVMESEAELASVLAHGIGHVNARHGAQALVRQSGPQLGVWAAPVAELRSLDGGAVAGAGFLYLEHGADAERRADELAFRYMVAAGYDVTEVADVFSALARLETIGGRSALPSWLATHPDPGDRVAVAARRAGAVATLPDSLRVDGTEYLDHVEDLVYGQDPRQGFIRGSTFVHPELRFRVELPTGWSYRSLGQVVVATSPDRDAALQLTIVEQVSADEAAQRFVTQPGVQSASGVETDVVNGNPRVMVAFRATTGAGPASGLAAWFAYGGRTYQLVGIAARQADNGHAEAFRQTMGSFAAVSDPRLLDVRPNRINIVRLGRATTFAEFNRRYPSVVDAEEVALLNRVAGASARLRPGGRMKRVVKG